MKVEDIVNQLIDKGLKVTPQRISILEAIIKLNNHPTAENIIDYIRQNHPHIAFATVYKVLDALVENNLIKRVKTEKDVMRYDAEMDKHHHIYCSDSDRIEDFKDNELDEILKNYFEKKGIPDFNIEDIRLHVIGKYIKGK
jgi:Fur family transcriptional regulator, peroxide stress response regulator